MPGPTKVAPAKYANELSEKDRIFNVAVKFLEKVGYEKLSILTLKISRNCYLIFIILP